MNAWPVAAIFVISVGLGLRRGPIGGGVLLAVILASWLTLGSVGDILAEAAEDTPVASLFLPRGSLGGDRAAVGPGSAESAPQPGPVLLDRPTFYRAAFLAVALMGYGAVWWMVPVATGLRTALTGGAMGALSAIGASLFLFPDRLLRLTGGGTLEALPVQALPADPGALGGRQPQTLIVAGVLLAVVLAVRAIRPVGGLSRLDDHER
ncbi:MAG: hypothetical protein ACE5NC_04580 [Anaerolineae bacterium]